MLRFVMPAGAVNRAIEQVPCVDCLRAVEPVWYNRRIDSVRRFR